MGMHMAGIVSLGLMVFYFILMIRSSRADSFNWMILVWIIVIGTPRIVFWLIHCNDSIRHRKWYAVALILTTLVELTIFVVN